MRVEVAGHEAGDLDCTDGAFSNAILLYFVCKFVHYFVRLLLCR